MLKRVNPIFRNFYVVGTVFFLVWMSFLDQNDFLSRFRLTAKLRSLEAEKEYYEEKIEEVQKDHDDLFGDRESVEKFAREKYLMKKETEEIFLVVEE
ncbi:septum formation initiator [Chryseotalea sanaruensis]|uniref:Septum formation initiator n=1 Tax=Chryseotalea sanaruensis TaxID=2482724 RepID=A0A401UBN9_9BACT|nr:septum formation initiator family protein [Chryseotalea sanaruensis]GCC52311.1 septum formation initiator [Chryseotalea sanaruensis]